MFVFKYLVLAYFLLLAFLHHLRNSNLEFKFINIKKNLTLKIN